ncbi:hypothetical protein B296_00002282 [Ensete ventricosum]|uniref:Uncharacterized protein n=1 Tax=Ensete ventricosum TaxID=4639 RepID=A0A427B740_ENSVE|nr:hypothetical protein B296_00002282 [Ensete ventricosum]
MASKEVGGAVPFSSLINPSTAPSQGLDQRICFNTLYREAVPASQKCIRRPDSTLSLGDIIGTVGSFRHRLLHGIVPPPWLFSHGSRLTS